MESLDALSEYEKQNFFIAIAMLVMGTITIISYAYTGAGTIFIVLAVITIIVGLYMASRISKEDSVLKESKNKKKKQ